MATVANKTIVKGWRVLEVMAAHPRKLRTPKSIAADSLGDLTEEQVLGALLAFAEVGVVQTQTGDNGVCFYLLGAKHLQLAQAELAGLGLDARSLRETLDGYQTAFGKGE